jgi:histidine triad (HIT) family protein
MLYSKYNSFFMDQDCIFCKIARGEVSAHKVYEDEDYLAFLDVRPLNPGHTLVIPKEHYRWVWDVPDLASYYRVAGKVVQAIREAFNTDYVVSLVLGEEVPHAHIWLVPRFEGDGHGGAIDLGNVKDLGEEEMEDARKKIRSRLES